MDHCPATGPETASMLSVIGVKSIDELFSVIPEHLRARSFNLAQGMSEHETLALFRKLAAQNDTGKVCFLGGGMYDHIIPAAVDTLTSRAEFYTAYTPYQPESSQGTLQALFEYQTAISRLTGLEVSNASLYDGATALAESILLAMRVSGRNRVLIDHAVSPLYMETVRTYLKPHKTEIVTLDFSNESGFNAAMNSETACAAVSYPDFFGNVRDYTAAFRQAKQAGALSIASVYPAALGIYETPAVMGADLVCGDAQSLGNPMSFGGPSLGFLTARTDYIRSMPGRIVGQTVDKNGKRGFVLTLQAREQHIKRHRATSNICSNQSLCALRSLVFLALTGSDGFVQFAMENHKRAVYLKERLSAIKGVQVLNKGAIFNEFTVSLPVNARVVLEKLLNKGIAGGLPLSGFYSGRDNDLLVAVTEKRTLAECGAYAAAMEEILCR